MAGDAFLEWDDTIRPAKGRTQDFGGYGDEPGVAGGVAADVGDGQRSCFCEERCKGVGVRDGADGEESSGVGVGLGS